MYIIYTCVYKSFSTILDKGLGMSDFGVCVCVCVFVLLGSEVRGGILRKGNLV